MLTGYAIECAFKCLWVKTGHGMVEKGSLSACVAQAQTTTSSGLANVVGFLPNPQQERDVLTRLSKFIPICWTIPDCEIACGHGPFGD